MSHRIANRKDRFAVADKTFNFVEYELKASRASMAGSSDGCSLVEYDRVNYLTSVINST